MTLEEKIKKLLEQADANQKVDENGNPIPDQSNGATVGGGEQEGIDGGSDATDGGQVVPVGDDTEEDDGEDDADQVKEDYTADQYNKEHEQPGMKNVDDPRVKPALSPEDGVNPEVQDDNGDNAKLLAGKKNVDGTGPGGQPIAGVAVDGSAIVTNPQGGVQEHMTALFSGETLSEEFKTKASTIFEAAVNVAVEQRLQEEVETLKEEFDVRLDEAVEAVKGDLVEDINNFLSAVVEQWIGDNKIALESGIKVEMVNNFIDGLKTLFKESYVEIPDEKFDVVAEQASKIEELKQVVVVLDEAHDAATAEVQSLKKSSIVESVGSALTAVQKVKFSELCEGLTYQNDEEFKKRVETIKESYFPAGKAQDSVVEQAEANSKVQPSVSAYVSALSKPLKF